MSLAKLLFRGHNKAGVGFFSPHHKHSSSKMICTKNYGSSSLCQDLHVLKLKINYSRLKQIITEVLHALGRSHSKWFVKRACREWTEKVNVMEHVCQKPLQKHKVRFHTKYFSDPIPHEQDICVNYFTVTQTTGARGKLRCFAFKSYDVNTVSRILKCQ